MKYNASRFTGRIALVTGAGGGLGSAIAKMFAQQGATVIVSDICFERGEAVTSAISHAGGRAFFVGADVTAMADWSMLLEHITRTVGNLHILINNAGIVSRASVSSISLEEWWRVININLTGALLGIQTLAPLIRDSGGGSIVNISSTAGLIGHPGAAYAATKWGLRGLTKSAALELLNSRIRVNSVHPAQVSDTFITSNADPNWRGANELAMPAGRSATPPEVAQAVLFLASDESSYINGSEIVVDGGATSIGLPYVRSVLGQKLNETNSSSASPLQ